MTSLYIITNFSKSDKDDQHVKKKKNLEFRAHNGQNFFYINAQVFNIKISKFYSLFM